MSWIVQTLLNKRTEIKSSPDLESDQYNDLLLVEKAMSELLEKGVITSDDLILIDFFGSGNIPLDSRRELNKHRVTVARHFDAICERIAFYLGGYFTNDGYIDYMVNKYKLSEEQESTLRDFIRSKYRHRIIRKTHND